MKFKDIFKKTKTEPQEITSKPSYYSKECVLDRFPEKYEYTKEYIEPFLDKAINASTHRDAQCIFEAVSHCPQDQKDKHWDELTEEDKKLRDEFLDWRRREFEEWGNVVSKQCWSYYNQDKILTIDTALKTISEFWDRVIFDSVFQDNGAQDEPHGPDMMFLGSFLKSRAKDNITPQMRSLVKEAIYNWYDKKICSGYWYDYLSCDYGPCKDLYDILKNAGVDERSISDICPWKTWAKIDSVDRHVLVCEGYNNFKVI